MILIFPPVILLHSGRTNEDILREIKQLSLLIMELMDLYQERIHEDGNPPDLTVAKAIGDRIESSRKLLRKNALKSVKVMESKNGAEVYLDVLNEMDLTQVNTPVWP